MKPFVLAAAVLAVPFLTGPLTQDPVKYKDVKSEVKKVADAASSVGSIYMPDHHNAGSIIIVIVI
jgi:hypothetical protein